MQTFFIRAGLMLRSFFIGLARKLARTAKYMMTGMFCAGSTPAAGIITPRKTLYLAFCGAFSIGAISWAGMNFGTLRRL